LSQNISQTEKASFQRFSVPLICSTIIITATKQTLSYFDHDLSSEIILRKV